MISLELLKQHGLTDDALRGWFAGDPKLWAESTDDEKKRSALQRRIRSRTEEGMARNWEDYRTFAALDKAWDQPFYQITPTILANFIDSDPNNADVQKQLDSWGLSHLISDEVDPKTNKPVKKLNLPVFFKIFVPLVRAYVTIRWAKIMNDRRQTPFFKYEPFKQTTPLRLKCEAITDRINIISEQYGYYDVMKQAVHKMLLYSYCIQFVSSEWDSEEQWRKATEQDVTMGKTKTGTNGEKVAVSVGDEIKVTTREGLGYHQPHPSRIFWDMSHGKHTLNYDYGCKFGGYWKIMRYRDVEDAGFWNTGAVALGTADIIANHRSFFNTAYSACTLTYGYCQPPTASSPSAAGAEVGAGASPMDRERQLATQYYSTEQKDQGVLVTEYFEKLVPKDNGMGTYDCPVWFRFVIAGDGATILYAAPLPYNPMIYYGYDADESRAKNPSLGLEVLPFQDHFGNMLTQIILTAKQNLANMTLLDEDQLDEGQIKQVRNMGGGLYSGLNVFGFSGKKAFRGQNRVVDLVHSYNLPKGNVGELTNVLKTILDVMERVLVMSSQEVGQAASHEQTKEEVKQIHGNTSTRLQFTSTPVDIATSAWKRQLYQGVMAYGDDDMWAHLPSDIPLTKEALEAFGFTYVDKDETVGRDRYRTVRFKKDKTAMDMWTFANTRDDTDRTSDREVAIAMSAIVKDMLNNPMTAQAIGPDQAIDLANQIARLAGLPRDFKLKNANSGVSDEQRKQQAQEQLKQVVEIVMGQVNQQMQKDLDPLLAKVKDQDQKLAILMPEVGRLTQTFQAEGMDAAKLQMAQAELTQKMQIQQQEFTAEQSRKQQQHELDMQITASKAGLDLKVIQEKTNQDLKLKEHAAAVDATAKLAVASAKASPK